MQLRRLIETLIAFVLAFFQRARPAQIKIRKRLELDVAKGQPRASEILNAPALPEEPASVVVSVPEPVKPEPDPAPGERTTMVLSDGLPPPHSLIGSSLTALSAEAISEFAQRNGVTVVDAKTVIRVEASQPKGFDPKTGKPIILFEYHKFSEFTDRKFDGSHPHLSNPKWRGIPYPRDQKTRWAHLQAAWELDPSAAYRATSFGLFQCMGDVFRECGCKTLAEFISRVCLSEAEQLVLFDSYINRVKDREGIKLVDHLRERNWFRFAVYNTGNSEKPAVIENRRRYEKMLVEAFAEESHLAALEVDRQANVVSIASTPRRAIPKHSLRCKAPTGGPCTCGGENLGASA